MMLPRLLATLVLSSWSAGLLAGPSLCANAEQAAKVREAYAAPPAPPTFMAASKLALPEAVVLSALAGKGATGTTGAGFEKVWAALQSWDDATVVLLKGGNVVEVRGRIPPGEPSSKSQFFNLKQDGAGLGGHFRPDLMGAIYAVELAGAQGPLRGVTFVDLAGESLFGVYLPEGAGERPELVGAFARTRELIAELPRACP
jgi:putative heme iron utilization protein